MPGLVEGIYVARGAGAPMDRVREVAALEGCGLAGDRYCEGTGHWSRFGRTCQVTLIAAEDPEAIEKETGIRVRNGEHRRNVVTRRISLKTLRRGERFRVGELAFEYRGPRSVCRYIERLTEPGMTQALKGRGGICARVVENGTIRVADEIEVLYPPTSTHRGNGMNDERHKGCADERRTERRVARHILERNIGVRGYVLCLGESSTCK